MKIHAPKSDEDDKYVYVSSPFYVDDNKLYISPLVKDFV